MKLLTLSLLIIAIFGESFAYPKNGRIVGGTDAVAGQFPYTLSVQNTLLTGYQHICGASIYSTTWAISSADCVRGFTNQTLELVAGEIDFKVDSGYEQRRNVINMIQHPDYNRATKENDVAVMQVESAFVFNDYVGSIALATTGQTFPDGTLCDINGWGTTIWYIGEYPDSLQWAQVPTLDDKVCRDAYNDPYYDSMLCAGDNEHDGCIADQGAPLACNGFLAAIYSWSYQCAHYPYPGIYTEVSYFYDWITSTAV